MYCSQCGKEYAKGQRFCTNCGNRLVVPQPEPAGKTKKKAPLILIVILIAAILIACAVLAFRLLGNGNETEPDPDRYEEADTADESSAGEDTVPSDTETESATEEATEEATEKTTEEATEEPQPADSAAEAAFTAFYLTENEPFYYDLDNDGEAEEIMYVKYTDYEDYFGCEIQVYINSECRIDEYREYAITGSVMLCDFVTGDPYKEIYLGFTSDSDCFDKDIAYRYSGGSVLEYYSVAYDEMPVGRWSLDLDMSGDGTVCYDQEFYTQYLGQGYAHRTFRVENGTLVQIPTHVYAVTDDWKSQEYHALISIPLLSEADGEPTGASIEPGDCFYLQEIYTESEYGTLSNDILYVHVTTQDGTDGWIAVPDEEFFEESTWRMWG